MKKIKLTQGKYALVDDEWYEYLNQFKWCYYAGGYAARQTQKRRKKRTIYMHRQIADTPPGLDTDHINGDKLDNRSENLRVISHHDNLRSYMKLDKRNRSGYRGVSRTRSGKWRARVGRKVYLGSFETPEDAAKAIKQWKEDNVYS